MYELSNHLGNVLTTISNQKVGTPEAGNDWAAEYYEASLFSAQDYYPFGLEIPNPNNVDNGYRYGFNGKENDRDWGGDLIQDYGFRMYSPRIGKFMSVDPLMRTYPMLTPYQFASNRPIDGIDLDGLEYSNSTGTLTGPLSEETLLNSNEPIFELYDVNENGAIDTYLPVVSVTPNMHDTPWINEAESQLGVTEDTNKNDGTEVELYLKSTGLKAGNPWCGAFVNWCLEEADIDGVEPTTNEHPARALSWRTFGGALEEPAYGSIATKTRRGGGHVG
ncbi:MAG TPA: hypothetical protein ENJ28_09390, partial [Gammaproteobacteria bacterium]|nr:hypothetical protein [Gammaproteobacteria bacterium]